MYVAGDTDSLASIANARDQVQNVNADYFGNKNLVPTNDTTVGGAFQRMAYGSVDEGQHRAYSILGQHPQTFHLLTSLIS